jgi:hypothetical protein
MTQDFEEHNASVDTDDSDDSLGDSNPEPPKTDKAKAKPKRKPTPKIPLKDVLDHEDDLSEHFTGYAKQIGNGTVQGFCNFLQRDGHKTLRRKDYDALTSTDKAILEPEEGPQASRKRKVDLLVAQQSAKTTDLSSSEEVLAVLSIQQSAAKRLKEMIYQQHPSLKPKRTTKTDDA